MSSLEDIYFLQIKTITINDEVLSKGVLLKAESDKKIESGRPLSLLVCSMHEGPPQRSIELIYYPNDFQRITSTDFFLLLPVKPAMRCKIYFHNSWMEEGRTMKNNDEVIIFKLNDDAGVPGTIRYVGDLYDVRAIFFGIELDKSYAGKGSSDGFFRGRRFNCNKDCAVFRNLSEIRKKISSSTVATMKKDLEVQKVSSMLVGSSFESQASCTLTPKDTFHLVEATPNVNQIENKKVDCGKHEEDLQVNEKVVYQIDSDLRATVKWIGKLPGKKDLYAGLELEDPNGTGTGKYEGIQYFRSKKDHALFIPVDGLVRAVDLDKFLEPSTPKPLHKSKHLNLYESSVIEWRSEQLSLDCTLQMPKSESYLHETHKCISHLETLKEFHCITYISLLILKSDNLPPSMSSKIKNQDTLRGTLVHFLEKMHESTKSQSCFQEDANDLKNILDLQILNPKISFSPIVEYSLKLLRMVFGFDAIKLALISPSFKRDYLCNILKNSENNDFVRNHFNGTYIYMVAIENDMEKNNIVPSLTLDCSSLFLSCHSCNEYLSSSDCSESNLFDFICCDCLKQNNSLRLSAFCRKCFDSFHQSQTMNHSDKKAIDLESFECDDTDLSHHLKLKQRKDFPLKMELFAFVSLTSGILKLYYKCKNDWYVKENMSQEVELMPNVANFLKNCMTCPFDSYDLKLQQMLDGIKICYYQSCDL